MCHEKGIPFVDLGATAKMYLADGSTQDIPVTTVSNSVPSPCDTLGSYEVEYEAEGLYGFTSWRTREVEIGRFISHVLRSSFPRITTMT